VASGVGWCDPHCLTACSYRCPTPHGAAVGTSAATFAADATNSTTSTSTPAATAATTVATTVAALVDDLCGPFTAGLRRIRVHSFYRGTDPFTLRDNRDVNPELDCHQDGHRNSHPNGDVNDGKANGRSPSANIIDKPRMEWCDCRDLR